MSLGDPINHHHPKTGMRIEVHVFAWLRDVVGKPCLAVELDPSQATAAGLLEVVCATLQTRGNVPVDLAARLSTCKVALNEAYVDLSATISATDEVALIPPVSGG